MEFCELFRNFVKQTQKEALWLVSRHNPSQSHLAESDLTNIWSFSIHKLQRCSLYTQTRWEKNTPATLHSQWEDWHLSTSGNSELNLSFAGHQTSVKTNRFFHRENERRKVIFFFQGLRTNWRKPSFIYLRWWNVARKRQENVEWQAAPPVDRKWPLRAHPVGGRGPASLSPGLRWVHVHILVTNECSWCVMGFQGACTRERPCKPEVASVCISYG